MNFSEIISKTKLQVRRECQFFGALMLFASIKETTKLDTAATDGRDIFFNKKFLESLTSSEQNALMLHEVLHMALLHVQRRQSRDPYIWNIAADIVVNDLIQRNTSFKLPKGAVIDHAYRDKSVEYIYEALLKDDKYKAKKYKLSLSYLKFKDKLLLNKDLSKEFTFLKDQLINSGFEDDITKFEKIVKYYQNDKILLDNFNNISPKLIARDRNDPEDGFVNKFRFNLNNLIIIKGSKNNKSLSKIEKFIFSAQNFLEVRDYKNLTSEIAKLDVAFQDILSNFSKQIDIKILIEEFDNKYVDS